LISNGADPIDPHRRAAAGLDSCPLGISLIGPASADEVLVATAQWIMA
jgi:Asp-tRNA(Asn)/Glu-tRNA(Gln) amidotransferase A subunit family amidase